MILLNVFRGQRYSLRAEWRQPVHIADSRTLSG
jgi:hypothetical protein